MLDINTIEKLDKIATPFYYYDMDLFRKTVEIGRASCRERVFLPV